MLSQTQGQILVRLAREHIEKHLGCQSTTPVSEEELNTFTLQNKSGVFVTLHQKGALRGCIGSLTAQAPLKDGVRQNALNAAFQDFRFSPLTAADLPSITIEISILTEPVALNYQTSHELIQQLRPKVDGVILQGAGGEKATFLPQVWHQLPTPEHFLEQLCRKAGLAANAWRSGALHFSTYQVQSFQEPQ